MSDDRINVFTNCIVTIENINGGKH